MSVGERPRRRWRIEAYVEGNSWEEAGQAFSKVLHILMAGKPEQVAEGRPLVVQMDLGGSGFRLNVSQDPKMIPSVYEEVMRDWKKAEAELQGEKDGEKK